MGHTFQVITRTLCWIRVLSTSGNCIHCLARMLPLSGREGGDLFRWASCSSFFRSFRSFRSFRFWDRATSSGVGSCIPVSMAKNGPPEQIQKPLAQGVNKRGSVQFKSDCFWAPARQTLFPGTMYSELMNHEPPLNFEPPPCLPFTISPRRVVLIMQASSVGIQYLFILYSPRMSIPNPGTDFHNLDRKWISARHESTGPYLFERPSPG